MTKIILPNTYEENIDAPLIFLAGPIRGAPDWHYDAMNILLSNEPEIIIASPRGTLDESFSEYRVVGRDDVFRQQRSWERHYLDIASKSGAVLFWLAEERKHNCHKPYASMTRVELGQLMTQYKFDPTTRLCIGYEGVFQDLDAIMVDLSLDAREIEVKNSLEETCLEALRLASVSQ